MKSPKVYVRDTGLLHCLLGVRNERGLLAHPKSGASWEGYAIEETIKAVQPDEAYFWATHHGAELDLLLFKHGRRLGVEVKRVDALVTGDDDLLAVAAKSRIPILTLDALKQRLERGA